MPRPAEVTICGEQALRIVIDVPATAPPPTLEGWQDAHLSFVATGVTAQCEVSAFLPGLHALLGQIQSLLTGRASGLHWRAEENWMELRVMRARQGAFEADVRCRFSGPPTTDVTCAFRTDATWLAGTADELQRLLAD